MTTMNTMMTRGMRVVITDVAVCVLSLAKAFGAVFFLLCLLCVIVLSIFALVDRHSRYKATGKLMGKVGELTGMPTDDIEVEQSREDYGPMVLSLVALPAMLLAASGMLYLILSLLGSFGS
mgnify:FL=1|jgi:hypothetical protein